MRANRKRIGKKLAFGPVTAPVSSDPNSCACAAISRDPNDIPIEIVVFDSARATAQKSFDVHDLDTAACRIAAE